MKIDKFRTHWSEEKMLAIYDKHGPAFVEYLDACRSGKEPNAYGAGSPGWFDGLQPEGSGVWMNDVWPSVGRYQCLVFVPLRFLSDVQAPCDDWDPKWSSVPGPSPKCTLNWLHDGECNNRCPQ